MSLININSKNIYYEEYGEHNKHTIVYFHGGPGEGCWSYVHQAKILGEKYHVVIFDQYGVLRSDTIPENESCGVADHVEMIDKMRNELGIEKWTVLGHSYGGMLACLYAYTYPNNIRAVIYDNPTWNWTLTARTIASALIPYFQKTNNDELLNICSKILDENTSAKETYDSINDLFTGNDEEIDKYLHVISMDVYNQYMEKHSLRVNVDDWQKYKIHTQKLIDKGDFFNDYIPCLKDIKVSSLLMVGEHDITCGKDQQGYFRDMTPNGTFVEFQNSAHLLWIQEQEAYTKTIIDFLDTVE